MQRLGDLSHAFDEICGWGIGVAGFVQFSLPIRRLESSWR